MKRNLLFTLLLLVMAVFAKAQAPIFQEDFEGGTLPAGWTTIDADGDDYDWMNSAFLLGPGAGHAGSDYCMLSQSYDNDTYSALFPDNWLITPPITLDNSSMLHFWVCGQDQDYPEEHYGVYVSYNSATDTNDFNLVYEETIGRRMTRGQSTWVEHIVDLSEFTGATVYIAFRHFNCTDAFYLDLDDVSVIPNPTSPAIMAYPSTLDFNTVFLFDTSVVKTVQVTGFFLSSDITVQTSIPFEVSEDNVNYSDMIVLPDTGGVFYVRYVPYAEGTDNQTIQLSSGSTSASCSLTGQCLDCGFPIHESFESELSACWKLANESMANINVIDYSTDYASDGAQSLVFSSYFTAADYNYNQYLISPMLPTDVAKMMSFDYRSGDVDPETFQVGFSTTTADFTAFTWSDEIIIDPADGWKSYLNTTIPANVKYVAIRYTSYYSYYLYIDNLKIEEVSSCMYPSNLVVDNIKGTSARVAWTPADGLDGTESFMVEYGESSDLNFNSMSTSDNYVLLSGLSPNTEYEVMLYMLCSGGTSDTVSTTFTTGCLSGGPQTIGSGSATSYIYPINNYYSYSYSQQIYLSDEIGTSGEINTISFDYAYSNPYSSDDVVVYLGHTSQSEIVNTSSSVPFSDLTRVYSGSFNFAQGWNEITLDSSFYYNGQDNLVLAIDVNSENYHGMSYVFRVHSTGDVNRAICYVSDYNDVDPEDLTTSAYADYSSMVRNNVIFGMACDSTVSCLPPNMIVADALPEEVTIDWVPGNSESSWTLEYQIQGDSSWTMEGVVTSSPYTISGLESSTAYRIRMYSNCESGEASSMAMAVVTTPCEGISIDDLPFVENFNDAVGRYLPCWSRGTNYPYLDYPYIVEDAASASQKYLSFYGYPTYYSYAALPAMDEEISMDNLIIKFDMYMSDEDYFVEVGVMTDPEDYSTFTSIAQLSASSLNVWEPVELVTSAYTGTGRNIAFRTPMGYYNTIYLDNISVDVVPSCFHVNDITVSNVTTSTADIHWMPGAGETSWQYVYAPYGTIDVDNDMIYDVFEDSVNLIDLAGNTYYEILIRANCGNGEYSEWASATFRTGCVAITNLPYEENFDTYVGMTSTSPSQNVLPNCWEQYFTGPTTSTYAHYPYIYQSQSNAASGRNAMRFYIYNTTYTTSAGDQMAILPEIDASLPISILRLGFSARRAFENDDFVLVVGVMEDTTFVPMDTINVLTNTYEDFEVNFGSYVGTTGNRIAILAARSFANNYNAGYVDNIVISSIPNCDRPSEIHVVNISDNTIEVAWTPNIVDDHSWILEYKESTDNEWISMNVANTPSAVISGLIPSTAYDIRVRTDCGVEGISDERNLNGSIFTNACPSSEQCSYTFILGDQYGDGWSGNQLVVIQNGNPIATLTAQNHGGSSYNDAATDTITLAVCDNMDLQFQWVEGSYSYEAFFSVYDINENLIFSCTDGSTLDEGVIFTGTVNCALPTCPRPRNIAVSNITTTSVDVNWTEVGSATEWLLEYREEMDASWQSVSVTSLSYTLNNLTLNTTYEIRVSSVCGSDETSEPTDSVVVTTAPCDDACVYRIEMEDSYGDGWSGNAISILVNGTVDTTVAVPDAESTASFTFYQCTSGEVSFVWSEGSYSYEASFAIYDGDGNELFSAIGESLTEDEAFYVDTCGNVTPPTPVDTCHAPMQLAASNVTHYSVDLDWAQAGDVNSWTVYYKEAAAAAWNTIPATTHPMTISDLTAETTYMAYVTAVCEEGESEPSNTVTFTTEPDGVNDYVLKNSISLYPNPAKEQFTISCADVVMNEVVVYDVYGKTLRTMSVNDNTVVVNVNDLAAGMYFVRIITNEGMATKTFVKK